MYPGKYAQQHAERPAFIMATSGESLTYAQLEARSNRLAHLLRAQGLKRLDHFAVFMENNRYFIECCVAGERTGLYYTCINAYLTAQEMAYIVNNSESRVLITSAEKLAVARQALAECPKVTLCLVAGGGPGLAGQTAGAARLVDLGEALADLPDTPVADEWLGTSMLYSSGTTGRPKGVLRPLPEEPPSHQMPLLLFLSKLWQCEEGMIYLSPAPLYHSAPLANVSQTIRHGGTAIIMEHFDPQQYLALIPKHRVTHTQLVPTMFSRLLKLPPEERAKADMSTVKIVVHAAAPCPVQVKEEIIAWWGPIVHEYYGATEGLGFTACDTPQWLAHRGSVGKVLLGDIHIFDEQMQPVPRGQPGEIWFRTATPFVYFNDPERTALTRSPDGTMSTVGDMGYVDDDGYLYLTDRSTFMIISGGVNIYPQECENLLVTHPKVADAAVFGVPNADLGEEVKAVVQPVPGLAHTPELAAELIDFCQSNLTHMKCPKSVDFTDQLPRLPTGKLYKRKLRDAFWEGHASRVV
ncbi:AMP-binding protein [Variovorax sp. dw_954]|uniref:AMP-binding protein n=1 Tax=Variovorax sp. dw_954 TaxID=2720078 RepID=UPI001BD1F8D1|nr:AMP-binding protein [Variovorax sp. dw_954]